MSKMGKEIARFGDTQIKKQKFHCYKNPFFIKDMDIDNIKV